MKKYIPLLLIAFFTAEALQAQYYIKGQDPASIHWKEINTEHFQVLFPENYSKEGQRLTNILEYSFPHVSEQLGHQPSKIPVIVHNYSAISNGFVSWAPKRIELYPVPDPGSFPQESLEQLVLHELRHVVQVDKLNQGFTRLFSLVLGQQAVGGVSGIIPFWLLEGDAVYSETSLSHSGRGSLPFFKMKLRALSLEKDDFCSFDKMFFGSYKNYIPDYYQYGYQMVTFSMQKYGESLWGNSIDFIAKNPYTFFPLHISLKKQTGLSKRELYKETFNHLHKEWEEQNSQISFTEFDTINKLKRKSYTSYRFPQYLNDTIIIAEKSGTDQIKEFITLNTRTGEEKMLHKPGYYQSVRLSAGSNKIVWSENIPDPRWGNRSYYDIKIFDLVTSNETRLTNRNRYFSPAISADGKKIVTVEISKKNYASLVILDTQYGRTIQKIEIPRGLTPLMPTWSESDGHIFLTVLSGKGKSIREVDPETQIWKTWVTPGFDDIMNIVPLDDFILFHATYSGIDNIYALNKNSMDLYQVTSSKFGAFDVCVSPDRSQIVFSDYTSTGYNLGKMIFDPDRFQKTFPFKNREEIKVNNKQKKFVFNQDSIPDTEYEITSYKKGLHLLNFHSWMPFYFDLDNIELTDPAISPGFTLFSQDNLSTTITTLGYEYKNNRHYLHSKLTYKGIYPVIELSADYGGTPVIFRDSAEIPLPENYSNRIDFRSKIYLPLNLTHNRFGKFFKPSFELIYTNSFLYNGESQVYEKGRMFLKYRLYYSNLLKLSHRDFQPRWGQVFDINFLHTPFDQVNYGNDFSFRTVLYFPGFLRHDGLKFKIGTEKQNPKKFIFYNTVDFPRGYYHTISEEFTALSGEYSVPLLYPDLNLFTLAYLKRFRGSVFVDYATGKRNHDLLNRTFNKYRQEYLSIGGGLLADVHFFRIPFPVSMGIEYAYMPYKNAYDIRFLFEINVFGFAINRN
jgi:hypothetical protein